MNCKLSELSISQALRAFYNKDGDRAILSCCQGSALRLVNRGYIRCTLFAKAERFRAQMQQLKKSFGIKSIYEQVARTEKSSWQMEKKTSTVLKGTWTQHFQADREQLLSYLLNQVNKNLSESNSLYLVDLDEAYLAPVEFTQMKLIVYSHSQKNLSHYKKPLTSIIQDAYRYEWPGEITVLNELKTEVTENSVQQRIAQRIARSKAQKKPFYFLDDDTKSKGYALLKI